MIIDMFSQFNIKSLCCGYSLKLLCSVDFIEYSQPMFQWRIVENDHRIIINYPPYLVNVLQN